MSQPGASQGDEFPQRAVLERRRRRKGPGRGQTRWIVVHLTVMMHFSLSECTVPVR